MIIKKAEVRTKGDAYSGVVTLTLVNGDDGWTYEIDGMTGDNITFTWTAESPEKATVRLQALYEEDIWDFRIIS